MWSQRWSLLHERGIGVKWEIRFSVLLKSIWLLWKQENTFSGDAAVQPWLLMTFSLQLVGRWMPLTELEEQSRPICLGCVLMVRILLTDFLLKWKDGQNEYTGCNEIPEINFIRNFQRYPGFQTWCAYWFKVIYFEHSSLPRLILSILVTLLAMCELHYLFLCFWKPSHF